LLVDVTQVRRRDPSEGAAGAEDVHVLAAENRLETLEQHRSFALTGLTGVPRDAALRALERAVIRDVRDVEARGAVPGPHVVLVPTRTSVVRVLRVCMEIRGENRLVGDDELRHRAGRHRRDGVDEHQPEEEDEERDRVAPRAESR
jgi:hypothetical protein